MKRHDSDQNQGEGDRVSARHYNRKVREYVAGGEVDDAARRAKDFVERSPSEAARAEERAKHGPHGTKVTIDELVAKGRSVVDRVRPMVARAVDRIRSRFSRR